MESKTQLLNYRDIIESASPEIIESVSITPLQQLHIRHFIKELDYFNQKYKIKLPIEGISKSDLLFWKEEKKNYSGIEIKGKFIEIYIPNLYEQTICNKSVRKLFKKHVPFLSAKKVSIFEQCENKYIKCLYKRKNDYLINLAKNKALHVPTIVFFIGDFAIKPENCDSKNPEVHLKVDNEVEYIDGNSNQLDYFC